MPTMTGSPVKPQTTLAGGCRLSLRTMNDVPMPRTSTPIDGKVATSGEALLDHWESLKSWIDEGRADLRFQRRALEAAEDWEAQGRPEGLLWRSPQLDLLRDFHKRKAADMPRLQIAFL
jgi:hypothetical protein